MPAPLRSAATAAADVCLIVEGAYPFVTGGVSSWLHDLVKAQKHLTFQLVAISADATPKPLRYDLPTNILGMTEIPLHQPQTKAHGGAAVAQLIGEIEQPLTALLAGGTFDDLREIVAILRRHGGRATRPVLLNSEPAFAMVQRMYERTAPGTSFLNYFWSWRALVGGLYSALLAPLPDARVYHAISTGYAGLVMACAVLKTGRPGLLTEHGIYTNERRIEIAMADWLVDNLPPSLGTEERRRDLRDVWTVAFQAYSRACYEASSCITTLYAENQVLQRRDGAPAERLQVIPNGIDYEHFSSIPRDPGARPPTVALIGRVVPIKDVKTYIRAVALLRHMIPGVQALLMGPTDEDPAYLRECEVLVEQFGLEGTFVFTGRVNIADYLGKIDVIVLTSISEAQPLVLLEAGAAGVPSVATNVGSCREILEGRPDEDPRLGPGGFVVPLADPRAVATALADLLRDPALHGRCARAIKRRAEIYYNKTVVDRIYRDLYDTYLPLPDRDWSVSDGVHVR
jgi:glycosyltransferase involved in cell wall biosynthesis